VGSSKIIFVGAIAVIVGLFGFGVQKSEKKAADIAAAHAYLLQAKTLGEQGLQVAARKLPEFASAVQASSFERTTNQGTYGYSCGVDGVPAGQVKIVSYGISNGQKATLVSVVEELPSGPKPSGVKAWKGWKLVSSVRTFMVLEQ